LCIAEVTKSHQHRNASSDDAFLCFATDTGTDLGSSLICGEDSRPAEAPSFRGAKTHIFCAIYAKNSRHFAKTGSGQT
jgi:hypothetical protein